MAGLYKKTTNVKCPKTGKLKKQKSHKWWGRYRDEHGVERRKPLAADKDAAQAMLNQKLREVERRAAGIINVFEEHRKRPLVEITEQFRKYLQNRERGDKHIHGVMAKIEAIAKHCGWTQLRNITIDDVEDCLAQLRKDGMSRQTRNHYVRAIKQFSKWLTQTVKWLPEDPLRGLEMLNVREDRRHVRRCLTEDEFRKLLQAARTGPTVESITGPDREIMYLLAAYTGFRKGEIGSIDKRSFQLDTSPPTVAVRAAYSKRRRDDVQVLHPALVEQLRPWLETKQDVPRDQPLWPVSKRVPGGVERKTSKMMQRDLKRAGIPCRDENNLVVDFHALRHTFITWLDRAKVNNGTRQSLARHSDIRLTMLYTHSCSDEKVAAIGSLPAFPPAEQSENESSESAKTEGVSGQGPKPVVPTMVPCGAEIGAEQLASEVTSLATDGNEEGTARDRKSNQATDAKSLPQSNFGNDGHRQALPGNDIKEGKTKVHPAGFEPATLGSEDRCAIQLRHGCKMKR